MSENIIAIANQKGDVGKTTTCVNLGFGLVMEGKIVLQIDSDLQGSLTITQSWKSPTGPTDGDVGIHIGQSAHRYVIHAFIRDLHHHEGQIAPIHLDRVRARGDKRTNPDRRWMWPECFAMRVG